MNIVVVILIIIFLLFLTMVYFYNTNKVNTTVSPQFKHTTKIVYAKKSQSELQNHIQSNIDGHIKDDKLKEILLYSLGSGKRVRPIIVISVYKMLNNTEIVPDYIINVALCIEYFHCASLIIDDIMDGDKTRRGKPAVYMKYGLTMAQMASIMLCSIAMKNLFKSLNQLSESKDCINKDIYLMVCNLLSEYITELSLGQYTDVVTPTSLKSLGDNINRIVKSGTGVTVEKLIYQKTTTLFEYCYVMPWLYTNSSKSTKYLEKGTKEMKNIAGLFGLIFQIADDFEDVKQDQQRDGENYVLNKGYDLAYKNYKKFVDEYNELTESLNIKTKELEEVISYLSEGVDYHYLNH